MPRSHARIYTKVWADPEFRARTAGAQRLYFLLLSQADLTHCGVLTYRPKRWASLARDTPLRAIEKWVAELEQHVFVVVDHDTDELWIRSFVKHDGILKSPNMIKAMWAAFDGVLSEPIREGFREGLEKHIGEGVGGNRGVGEGVGEGGAKIVRRCERCNLIEFDCQCDNEDLSTPVTPV